MAKDHLRYSQVVLLVLLYWYTFTIVEHANLLRLNSHLNHRLTTWITYFVVRRVDQNLIKYLVQTWRSCRLVLLHDMLRFIVHPNVIGDRLNRANVHVWSSQHVLMLRLFLIYLFYRLTHCEQVVSKRENKSVLVSILCNVNVH